MYTDPRHARVEDPGEVEGNVVFTYLDAFDPDRDGLEILKKRYRAGGLGDVTLKHHLIDVLHRLLTPIRARRQDFGRQPEQILRILNDRKSHLKLPIIPGLWGSFPNLPGNTGRLENLPTW